MKNYHYKTPKKSSASYLIQKFLHMDKRLRKNLLIGTSLVAVILITGFILAAISIIQYGGNLIDEVLADDNVQNSVEKIIDTVVK